MIPPPLSADECTIPGNSTDIAEGQGHKPRPAAFMNRSRGQEAVRHREEPVGLLDLNPVARVRKYM